MVRQIRRRAEQSGIDAQPVDKPSVERGGGQFNTDMNNDTLAIRPAEETANPHNIKLEPNPEKDKCGYRPMRDEPGEGKPGSTGSVSVPNEEGLGGGKPGSTGSRQVDKVTMPTRRMRVHLEFRRGLIARISSSA